MTIPARRLLFLVAAAVAVVCALNPPQGAVRAQDAGQAALAAAVQLFNGVPSSQCADGGMTPPAGFDACISAPAGALANAGTGLVLLQAWRGAGVQPRIVLMGLMQDGTWGLWFSSPAAYVPVALPDQAMICAEGGLNVRAQPSLDADVIGGLADGSVLSVVAFSLEYPGHESATQGSLYGQGWYQLAGAAGWIAGQYLVVADGNCGAALGQ